VWNEVVCTTCNAVAAAAVHVHVVVVVVEAVVGRKLVDLFTFTSM